MALLEDDFCLKSGTKEILRDVLDIISWWTWRPDAECSVQTCTFLKLSEGGQKSTVYVDAKSWEWRTRRPFCDVVTGGGIGGGSSSKEIPAVGAGCEGPHSVAVVVDVVEYEPGRAGF